MAEKKSEEKGDIAIQVTGTVNDESIKKGEQVEEGEVVVKPKSKRVAALDAFRGLTIVLSIIS